jgi:hypothetical protein
MRRWSVAGAGSAFLRRDLMQRVLHTFSCYRKRNKLYSLQIRRTTWNKCDCCGATMKYKRISPTYLYACDDCRPAAMKALGATVTAIAIGPNQ